MDIGSGKWLSQDDSFHLVKHVIDQKDGILTITLAGRDWVIEDIYKFSPGGNEKRIERKANLNSTAKEAIKFHGITLNYYLPMNGKYFFPATFFYDSNSTPWEDPVPEGLAAVAQKIENNRSGDLKNLPNKDMTGPASVKVALTEANHGRSELYFIDTRLDGGRISMSRGKHSAQIKYSFSAAGWSEPGLVQNIGSAWLEISDANAERTLADKFPKLLADFGLGVLPDRPQWVEDAAIFAYVVGRFEGNSITEVTQSLIPRIKELGFNTVWCLPVQEGTVAYNPQDYRKIEPKIGNWTDYQNMVDAFHKNGIRILQDIVPHGGGELAAIARGNPIDDMVFTPEGNILSGWGFDFNSPHWQSQMKQTADFYLNFKIDGFRVDAPYGSFIPNWRRKGFPSEIPGVVSHTNTKYVARKTDQNWWNKFLSDNNGEMPALPYQRGSLSQSYGGLNMIKALRETARKSSPDNALLIEIDGIPFTAVGDIMYDLPYALIAHKLRALPPGEFVKRFSLWLEEQKLTESPGACRMRFLSNDNDLLKGQLWTGYNAACAILAHSFFINSVPMVYNSNDQGYGVHIRRLNELRNAIPELRRGGAFYTEIKPSAPELFAVLRRMPDKSAIGLVNFSPEFVNTELELPVEKLNFKVDATLDLWEAYSGKKISSGKIADFKRINIKLEPWASSVLVWLPSGEQPEWAFKPTKTPDAVAKTTPVLDGVTVNCAAYNLEFDSKTGLIKSFSDGGGKRLLDNADLLFDPTLNSQAKATVTARQNQGSVHVDAKINFDDGSFCNISYDCLPDKVKLVFESSGRAATLMLPMSNTRDYQLDTVEGMLDDWITPVQKSNNLRMRNKDRATIDSTLIWRSKDIPLDMGRPELRTINPDKTGLTARLVGKDNSEPPSAELFNSFSGKSGLHYALTLNSCGVLELDLEPYAVRVPAKVQSVYVQGDLKITNESLGWRIENQHYILRLRRNGGVISELSRRNPDRLLIADQDIFTDKGFKTGKYYANCSSDVETEVEIIPNGKSFRLRFKSQLRAATNGGLLPYPLYAHIEYSVDESPSFGMLCSVKTAAGGIIEPSLRWQAKFASDLTAINTKITGIELLRAGIDKELTLIVDKESSPAKTTVSSDSNMIMFSWFDGKSGMMTPQRWYQTCFNITVGSSSPSKVETIAFLKDTTISEDPSFERVASVYSIAKNKIIPFCQHEFPDNLWWYSRYSSYPEFGSGKDSNVALRMNYPDPVYVQNFNLSELSAGKYRLSFQIKGEKLSGDIKLSVAIEYWSKFGKKIDKNETFNFNRSFDWQKKEMFIDVEEDSVTPFVKIFPSGPGNKPNYDGYFLLDCIKLEKLK
ncbi:MAG: alpha-amylase family glycosyl hydrolase [Lentisphaerota bacterium]